MVFNSNYINEEKFTIVYVTYFIGDMVHEI